MTLAFANVSFAAPAFLLAGAIFAALVVALGARLDRRRRRALESFNARATSTLSRAKRLCKRGLLALGVFAACAALARPQRGFHDEEVQKHGIDLLFAVDTSKSMLAPDLRPDRLTRAKLAIDELLPRAEGDRLGLIAFAGEAFLQVPLTLDEPMFTQALAALDTSIIPRGGTDVGRAIAVAREALKSEPRNEKIVVLLTDGEDLEAHALEEARAAAKDGVRLYTVGVGTTAGELVPLPGGGFARDETGAFVHSRLDEKTLEQLAALTGGAYRRLGVDGRGLDALYEQVLASLPKEARGARVRRVPIEQFQWPLGLAVLCFALEPLLGERRKQASQRAHKKSSAANPRAVAAAAAAAAACVALLATGARASLGDAEKDYRAGRFAKSADEYSQAAERAPGDARLQYNLGAAAYKKGDYAQARAAFEAALHTGALELQQKSYYDLGDAQFRTGEATEKAEPDQTIAAWKQSIASYESALKLDPKDADATFNRDFVRRKLAELEKKQEAQKQSQDQKQQQNQKPDPKKQQDQKQQAKNQQGPQKDQQGQQQPKDQQGQQQKDQQAQGQPKNQQGQQPKDQQAQQPEDQPDQQPKEQQEQAQEEKRAGAQSGAGQGRERDPRDDIAAPGKMSRNDARALLDALKGEERVMSFAGDLRTHRDDEPVRKDW